MKDSVIASREIGRVLIEVCVGDITSQSEIDAVVNPANRSLTSGGGVSGAIFAKAGKEKLSAACTALAPLEISHAVITSGFGLSTPNIIHCHGPKYGAENLVDTLEKTYWNVFDLAEERNISSLAIPAISAGAFGVPIYVSAKVAVETIKDFSSNFASVRLIRLVTFDKESADIYVEELLKPVKLPEKKYALNIDVIFTKDEFNSIKQGYLGDHDSKWSFYYEEPWLCIYHGNRKYGSCFFWLRFYLIGEVVVIEEAWADGEEQFLLKDASRLIQDLLDDRFGLFCVSANKFQVGSVEFWEKRGKVALVNEFTNEGDLLSVEQCIELGRRLIALAGTIKVKGS